MGVTAATPMLLLPALFLSGLLIAWLLMRRHQATMAEQMDRLRADRRRLSQKLRIARDRLVERRETAQRLQHDNALLLRAQDRLESEHAELAVRFANVKSAPTANPVETGFNKGSQRMARPFADSAIDKLALKAVHRDAGTGTEKEANEDWVASTEPVYLRAPRPITVEVPLTDLGPESLSDTDLVGATELPTSIELVSTRFAETLMKLGDNSQPVRKEAIKTLKAMEPDLAEAGPLSGAANDLPEELMLQLAEQDAEIERLNAQLAPLLGLPLAVAAREAERDQLARQLKERDAAIESLQAELELINGESESTVRAPSTLAALTASEPASAHYPPMPDQVDNLKRIRGIGPVLERMLNRLGIYQYRQIAAWTPEDVAYFDEKLKDFRGRIQRDSWIVNARAQHQSKYGITSE